MDRFRMNLVVDGLEPWAEDSLVSLASPEVTLQRVTTAERCIIVTTDQQTGERRDEDAELAEHHRGDDLSALAEHVQRRTNFESQFPSNKGVSSDVNLFISADVCTDCSHCSITVKSEERKQDKKDRTLGNHRFEDRVIWMTSPSVSEP